MRHVLPTIGEFLASRFKWTFEQGEGSDLTYIGLAISGGVDSMALATLYAKAIAKDRRLPTCHAFIIDHKARPESTDEAEWVQQQLRWKRSYSSHLG